MKTRLRGTLMAPLRSAVCIDCGRSFDTTLPHEKRCVKCNRVRVRRFR